MFNFRIANVVREVLACSGRKVKDTFNNLQDLLDRVSVSSQRRYALA